jgi:2-hydroxychromene-2-carboxylate isomerase
MTNLDFWYDFASTYSYPVAMRIEALSQERGIHVRWRPFLLGPIFAAQGWKDSPFNLYPVKGRYMLRDLERSCARLGLPFVKPEPFPQNSMLAARLALALNDAARPDFTRAVYRVQFAEGKNISERAPLADILQALGHHPAAVFEPAAEPPVKARLKLETETAQRAGVFGAPSFVTEDGELFWGNDRLEEAMTWALEGR